MKPQHEVNPFPKDWSNIQKLPAQKRLGNKQKNLKIYFMAIFPLCFLPILYVHRYQLLGNSQQSLGPSTSKFCLRLGGLSCAWNAKTQTWRTTHPHRFFAKRNAVAFGNFMFRWSFTLCKICKMERRYLETPKTKQQKHDTSWKKFYEKLVTEWLNYLTKTKTYQTIPKRTFD